MTASPLPHLFDERVIRYPGTPLYDLGNISDLFDRNVLRAQN